MDSGQYYCDVLDYNTGIWRICDNAKILEFSEYSDNVHDELSHENLEKREKNIMKGLDSIV